MRPLGPRLIGGLCRLLMAVFYRRVEVIGLEHVPARGPLLVAANHQNGLVDPIVLVASLPRRLVPLAKAPLFRHPLIAPFLRLTGALPVERREDTGAGPVSNEGTFRAVTAALRRGEAILIFPEGMSQPEPMLMTLRTGAARMLLDAEAAGRIGVTLLPVGLVYHEPGRFRAGRAMVLIGAPVPTDDCVALNATDPRAAARLLTDRLAAALRRQIVEAEDRETLRLLHELERVWRHESAAVETRADSAEWLQRAARAYRYLRATAPEHVTRFRAEVQHYIDDLERLGLTSGQLSRSYTAATIVRYTARETLALLAALPLALIGLVLHAVPYQLANVVVRWLRPEPDTEATYKMAASIVIYPLAWAAEAWLAWRLAGSWGLAAVLIALLPGAFFALTWKQRLATLAREARGLLAFLRHPDRSAALRARRRALALEAERLASRVPEPVLAGQAP